MLTMSTPHKSFCCSCTPRDSSFAVGILLTVFSSISFLCSLKTMVRLFYVETMREYFEDVHITFADYLPISIHLFQAIGVILSIISLIQVGAHVSLIVGVIKERADLVKFWLIFYKVLITLVTIAFGVVGILCFCKVYYALVGVFFFIIGILHACIAMYFIVVVGCHHEMLAENFTPFTNDYILELPRNGEKSLTPV